MTNLDQLKPEEIEIIDGSEILWRACGTHAFVDGQPHHSMFRLSSFDHGCLSVSQGSVRSPDSVIAQRESLGKKCVGVGGVTLAEANSLKLRVIDDSQVQTAEGKRKGHAYLDLRPYQDDKTQKRYLQMELLTFATTADRFIPKG